MTTHYPSTRRLDLVDTIHGVPVADPYRWLEDPHSVETAAWVDAQNALTRSKLDGSARDALVKDLTSRFSYVEPAHWSAVVLAISTRTTPDCSINPA